MGHCHNVFDHGVHQKHAFSSFLPPFSFFFFADERFFVGAHLAELLGRETFNLYGSLKRRKIALWRGNEALLHFLIARSALIVGTASLTLVRVDDVVGFVTKAVEDVQVNKKLRIGRCVLTGSNQRRLLKRKSNGQPKSEKLLTLLATVAGEEVAKKARNAPSTCLLE